MLKWMFNKRDESVVQRWIENPYWQYFTWEQYFQSDQPFDPSEFVHFRKRVGESGFEHVLSYTVALFKGASTEKEVLIDTTVQEKNITYPTDTTLAKKIIEKCRKLASGRTNWSTSNL
ncbi:MAG: IS5 family transposase [Marinoscillum sp.]|jgi:IS5 family transposase